MRGSSEVRLRGGLILIAILLSIFAARLVQLQGLDPKAYAAKADAQGLVTIPLPATRGQITDRTGAPLAESVSGMMIVADPTRTKPNAEKIARILANRLDLDYFDVLASLRKTNGPGKPDVRFSYVARRVPASKANAVVGAVKAAGFQGVDTRPDPLRYYPAKDTGANLLGFLGTDGKPLAGLELAFNPMLQGKDGTETFEVGGGNRIPLGENTEVAPTNGKNLTLTIDRDVQWTAQRLVRTAVENAHAESGSAIALDVKTGEILALADYPSYDANDPGASPKADRGSRALSNVYEPGSVEKVLTTSSLIDAGKVTPTTKIVVPHELPVADRVIHDYFDHGSIHLTLAGVIAKSSNIGTVLAARQFNHKQLWTYLDKFGLGHKTGIGLAGETRGLLPTLGSWTDLTQATVSFGQGVSVNALQMATAVNAVANGGELITPSLIKGTATTATGQQVGTDTATRTRVISPQAASATARMMEMVTTRGAGTAPQAGVPGYRVAGKTGTAQEVGAACKCYDSLAVSFAGFAPADDPRFTVYVVIHKPAAGASGGGTAGPVFRELMSTLLAKYDVPPTNTPPAALPVEW